MKFVAIFFFYIASVTPYAYSNDFSIKRNIITYSYVAITDPNINYTISGKLSIPKIKKLPPVIIIAHGSAGVDERGQLYAKQLNDKGFATFEIDMWSARGLKGGLSRPSHVKNTIPDIIASINFLKKNEYIDNKNIGLIGFSWGGFSNVIK